MSRCAQCGRLYAHTDKREQAQEHLRTATAMYREMDMRFWREQADAALADKDLAKRGESRP